MKKSYSILFSALAIAGISSCSEDKIEQVDLGQYDSEVEVTISTAEIQTRAAVTEFASSAQMNIFAKTYDDLKAPDIAEGIVATYDGAKWTMDPPVYIHSGSKLAFLYAVSPYDVSYTDPTAIPVDITKQVDLMYSGTCVPASRTTNNVKMTMNHALSLLSMNIVPVGYSGEGRVTSLSITGEGSATFYTQGTMNAESGSITLTETGSVTVNTDRSIEQGGWTSGIPGLWSLPFSTKGGNILLTAVIDGKEYKAYLPEVDVRQGYQYIFRLALTNSGLEFDPGKTERIAMNKTTDNKQEFTGHGKIVLTVSAAGAATPEISGSTVFGTVSTPSESHSYSGSVKPDGLKSGDQLTVEAWNAEGFTLSSLEGIDTIDISAFE